MMQEVRFGVSNFSFNVVLTTLKEKFLTPTLTPGTNKKHTN